MGAPIDRQPHSKHNMLKISQELLTKAVFTFGLHKIEYWITASPPCVTDSEHHYPTYTNHVLIQLGLLLSTCESGT